MTQDPMRADVRFRLMKEWCTPSASLQNCWLWTCDGTDPERKQERSVDKVTLFLLKDALLPVLLENDMGPPRGNLEESLGPHRDNIVQELRTWKLRDPSEIGVWPWHLYLTLLRDPSHAHALLQQDMQMELQQHWPSSVWAPLHPPHQPAFPLERVSKAGLVYPNWSDLAAVRGDSFVTPNRLMAWCYEAQAKRIARDANTAHSHRDAFLSYMLAHQKFTQDAATHDELCPSQPAQKCWESAEYHWQQLAPTIILKGNHQHLDLYRKYLETFDDHHERNFAKDLFYSYLKLEFLLRTSRPEENVEEILILCQSIARGLRNITQKFQDSRIAATSEMKSCLAEIAQVVAPRLNQEYIRSMRRQLPSAFGEVHVHVRWRREDLDFLSLPCLPKALKKQLLDEQAQVQLEYAPISLPF
jgi:hypothetical protein